MINLALAASSAHKPRDHQDDDGVISVRLRPENRVDDTDNLRQAYAHLKESRLQESSFGASDKWRTLRDLVSKAGKAHFAFSRKAPSLLLETLGDITTEKPSHRHADFSMSQRARLERPEFRDITTLTKEQSRRSIGTPGTFVTLYIAKEMLGAGQIANARELLSLAARNSPADQKIAALLEAISPGHSECRDVKFKNRNDEVTWLKENRQQYAGKWVALHGTELLASADTLKEVIAVLRERGDLGAAPLIKKIK